LINAFKKITGIPILFNTSFNLGGDPLVETFEDAINTLKKSKLEYLYVPSKGVILKKKNGEK
jgi:carbamoyltransferase